MRIAVVNTARNYGGQEAMAAFLSERLSERGHEVRFLCRSVYPALDRVRAAVPVFEVLGGVDWNPVSILRARRVLRDERIDVVLATTNKDMRTAALAAWSLRIPVVVRRAMARPLRSSAHYRFLYGRLPAHVVTNSRATHRIMLESAPWMDPDRTSVVYNGIDPAPFRRGKRADLPVPDGAVVVGFVGRFVDWKGVLTLAEAWRSAAPRMPAAHLVLAGEGEMEGAMRETLGDAERVHWIGFRDDVPEVMQALDILAFPSVMEGFGLAAVEAMAAGVPVVAARAAALPEVVLDGEQGRVVPPKDASALADAIEELVGDPELRARFGTGGRTRVDEIFHEDRMVSAYEAILAEAAATSGRPG